MNGISRTKHIGRHYSLMQQQTERRHHRLVKKAVDKAKEDWICRVAKEAEAATKDGRTRWERVRSLQQTHMGRRTIEVEVFGRRMAR